jgi:cytochrome c oxidase subunit 1/cytochrome c oxidase subunit I+III
MTTVDAPQPAPTTAPVDDERAAAIGAALATAAEDERIEKAWLDKPGLWGFFTTVDHKKLGKRYLYTAFVFFFLAGLQALVMRTQLARPDGDVVGPQVYNELFTMHGTTMIFLFNTPVFAGFANYLLPLQLGARDLAFPRLNAFSYWVFLFAGIFMYTSFLTGQIPDGGWFAYAPLTDLPYSSGHGIDFWGLGVTFVGVSTTVGAVNFIVTAFKLRAPGMTVNRMPLFVWSIIGMAFMVLFAVPAVTEAAFLLEMDRIFGTAFFDPARGGKPLLYQHLFWFWGHPEVYILFLPAVGIMLTTIPVFARQRLVGYVWAATAMIAIAFMSFGVWVHHMFATGMPDIALGLFSAVSLVIAVPSGVLYLCWIATLLQGKVRWDTPMLFSVGFLLIFLIGGLTGVMVAVMPFDWQVTDSYFIVAHFHYVLNGAVVFPIFAGIYFWAPKILGHMLSERLGKISFWTMFWSFHVAFFPMHILGLLGMPRRVYTYPDGFGWNALNLVSTIGAFVFGLGTVLTLVNVVWSVRRGPPAPANPWGADTLEWATASPPLEHNFTQTPIVRSRHPLWDDPPAELATSAEGVDAAGADGAAARTMLIVTGGETAPESSALIPQPTVLPFVLAAGLAVLVAGLLVEAWLIATIGIACGLVGIVWWIWRTDEDLR